MNGYFPPEDDPERFRNSPYIGECERVGSVTHDPHYYRPEFLQDKESDFICGGFPVKIVSMGSYKARKMWHQK